MTLANDDAVARVRHYLDLVATGTADQIAALFAEDATLEDPVGSDVRSGRAAIREFYATFDTLAKTTELLTIRACAGQAAFHFQIVTDTGGMKATMAPMEVMEFDDDGLITSMRAWWSDQDLTLA